MLERHHPCLTPWPVAMLMVGVAAAAVGRPVHAQTRPFTIEDMLAIVQISGEIAVSPDGNRLAYVLPDLADEWNVGERRQRGTIHVQDISAPEPGRAVPVGLPAGRWSSFPVFSPDGGSLAFYVEDADGGQLAVWRSASGTARVVGEPFGGPASMAPAWASNGVLIYPRPAAPASATAIDPPRVQVLQSSDRTLPGDAFFRTDRRSGLAVIDLDTERERELVSDDGRLRSFDLSPDGGHVLVSASEGSGRAETILWPIGQSAPPRRLDTPRAAWMPDGRLFWRSESGVVAVAVSGSAGDEDLLVAADADVGGSVIWAPDATAFTSLVSDSSIVDPEIEAPQPGMYTIARPFTDLVLRSLDGGDTINATASIQDTVRSPTWSADGRSLFFVATDNATYDETLYRYDVSSATLTTLSQGRESYGSLVPLPGGLLVSRQSATTPPDLWRLTLDSGTWTRLTNLNPQLSDVSFSDPALFHFDNADGDRLGGLLYKPPGANAADVPVVTYVYEKLTPGIHRFAPRQQIFATHGYAVLMPNVKVKVGETGTSFVKAVVPAVEAVLDMGFTNGRFCLWGGSFGAYATSFVITQTHVFDCAVSRATPPELFRNWASGRDRDSDNIESGQARMGGNPFEVMERYLSQSAFFHLDQVETPVLIMHGVKDYTILFEEGAMMFYALRRLEKEATFVAYRDGDHSLYRHSRADAIDVHRRMLDWFAKHLRPGR